MGGRELTQHAKCWQKEFSKSKYCPYCFIADAFIYYCLPLPIASAGAHPEFTSHFNCKAPELHCHVTDSAPCWLFPLACVCAFRLGDRSSCCDNFFNTQHILALNSLCQQLPYCRRAGWRMRRSFYLHRSPYIFFFHSCLPPFRIAPQPLHPYSSLFISHEKNKCYFCVREKCGCTDESIESDHLALPLVLLSFCSEFIVELSGWNFTVGFSEIAPKKKKAKEKKTHLPLHAQHRTAAARHS